MQNSDFWTRITSLYFSQTWPAILCMYKSILSIRITSLYGSQHSSVVFACKTATFGSAHKSLSVPDLTYHFEHTKNVISTRITSVYGFHPSSVVLCILNGDLRTKIACFYGSQTSPVVLCMQYSVISNRITSLYGFQPSSVVFACKTASFGPE